MEAPNLGPDWFWKVFFFGAIIGLGFTVFSLIKVIIWMFNHISFVE